MKGRNEQRRTTIRDVAKLADVSVASASRALNGLSNVTPETRERVLQAASALRFVPHIGARTLSTRRTETIGLILPDLYGEFFSELIRGIDAAARTRGLHLLVSSSHGNSDEAALAIRSMRGRVDGLLLMSPYIDAFILANNIEPDFPIVLMNTNGAGARFASFTVDNFGGALAIMRHLREEGHRAIAHIAGPAQNHEAQERLRGYKVALGEPKSEMVANGDFSEQAGTQAALQLLSAKRKPDAIFAANDMMAVGAVLALRELGLKCPDDVAIAGFDDIPIARLIDPALTTVQVKIADLGRRALESLTQRIEAGQSAEAAEVISPELIIRQSTLRGAGAETKKPRTGGNPKMDHKPSPAREDPPGVRAPRHD